MSDRCAYAPREGSAISRALAWLATQPPGAARTLRQICEALPDVNRWTLGEGLRYASARGALIAQPVKLPAPPGELAWALPVVGAADGTHELAAGELLDVNAVYLSPSGRRCRLLRAVGAFDDRAQLIYDRPDGRPAARSESSDGFTLAAGNWSCLRRVVVDPSTA